MEAGSPPNPSIWSPHPAYRGSLRIAPDGRIRGDDTGLNALSLIRAIPPTPNYDVSAGYLLLPGTFDGLLGICGRFDATKDTGYQARFNRYGLVWELHRFVNGVATRLASTPGRVDERTPRRLTLGFRGEIITLLVDGTIVLSVADDAIRHAGRAGVRYSGGVPATDLGGARLDDFAATLAG